MNKKEFLNNFDDQDKLSISNIYDKIQLASIIGSTVYSNEFCTPNIWSQIIKLKNQFSCKVECSGIFQDSERRMLAFSEEQNQFAFPYELMKIENLSKFDKLAHRDYLGAIMSLGLERNKIGDLVLKDNCCFVAVCEEAAKYISLNLNIIKRCPCRITILDLSTDEMPNINFEEFNIISTSLRLDCLVSSICNLSRSKALELIKSSDVLVDYIVVKEKNYNVHFGSTITIKGYGKYKVANETGYTNKERLKLLMKKFI